MRLEPPRRAPDNEQKLMVLACIERLGPCTEMQLLQFLFEHDLMNYFEMMFALNDLCDGGQAARVKVNGETRCEVTEAGREALGLFGGRVPRSLMELLEKEGVRWRQRFEQEAQSSHSLEKTERGDYRLNLTLKENEEELMHLGLTLPTRELARQVAEKWPGRAGKIYAEIIRLLSEEKG